MSALGLVAKAADFAARRHAGQRRKGRAGEPYLNHLAEVALLLAEATEGTDAALVAAGWLHDTVEDTPASREEIAETFGESVAELVAEVTDDKALPKAARKQRQVDEAPHKSSAAKALKLADKISNLRSLIADPPDDWERARLLEYVDWAEKVAAGCRGANPSLDRVFEETAAAARRSLKSERKG